MKKMMMATVAAGLLALSVTKAHAETEMSFEDMGVMADFCFANPTVLQCPALVQGVTTMKVQSAEMCAMAGMAMREDVSSAELFEAGSLAQQGQSVTVLLAILSLVCD